MKKISPHGLDIASYFLRIIVTLSEAKGLDSSPSSTAQNDKKEHYVNTYDALYNCRIRLRGPGPRGRGPGIGAGGPGAAKVVPARGGGGGITPLFSTYFPDKPGLSCGTAPGLHRLIPPGRRTGAGQKRLVPPHPPKFCSPGKFRGKEGEGQKGGDDRHGLG
jgi:hypothetical protein